MCSFEVSVYNSWTGCALRLVQLQAEFSSIQSVAHTSGRASDLLYLYDFGESTYGYQRVPLQDFMPRTSYKTLKALVVVVLAISPSILCNVAPKVIRPIKMCACLGRPGPWVPS